MRSVALAHEVDFEGWRLAARRLISEEVPPESVLWSVGAPDDLFAEPGSAQTEPPPDSSPGQPPGSPAAGGFSVPRSFVELAQTVIQARDEARLGLLYALLWRLRRGERALLGDPADPLVSRARRLSQSVRRDTHKMRAFLRFRSVETEAGMRYVAWFEPEHYIVEANADFFVRRFASMLFSILTPYRSLHWTGSAREFGPGAERSALPDDDALEAYWRAYFGAIFNPARLKVAAMTSEMPRKYWRNLPEAAAIPELIRTAPERTRVMMEQQAMSGPSARTKPRAAAFEPARQHTPREDGEAAGLRDVAEAAADCRRCPLWEPATQTVFGEGPADARMMMVGEQPGDQEDLAGRPFVGPAGQLLDRAIAEAGIDRQVVYVTNAVKHFKFEPRGKRRIHQKPEAPEIVACGHWLAEERRLVAPGLLLMLGATAARAVLGRTVTISRERGRPLTLDDGSQGLVTVHPSYLLRLPDEDSKRREYAAFVADLRLARSLLDGAGGEATQATLV